MTAYPPTLTREALEATPIHAVIFQRSADVEESAEQDWFKARFDFVTRSE